MFIISPWKVRSDYYNNFQFEFNGRVFKSIKKCCSYYGISYRSVKQRKSDTGCSTEESIQYYIDLKNSQVWLNNYSEHGGIPAAKKENKALIIESPRGLLSVKEVCEYTGLSEKTVRSSLMHGNGLMVKIGRRTLIHKKAFEKWLTAQTGRI